MIVGIDKARDILGNFRFSEFPIIREFHFYETLDNEYPSQVVEMTIESEMQTPPYRIQLRFTGVSGLRIDQFGGGETRVIGLDIIDVSKHQWEGIAWEVLDYENNSIGFLAGTAEVVLVSKADAGPRANQPSEVNPNGI